MILAALDTSCGAAFALMDDEHLLFNGHLALQGRDSDRKLMPWLLKEMTGAGISVDEVQRWVVGTGPGSFTGLRIGIAFVKGVCAGSGAQYRGIPSSLALARTAVEELSPGNRIGVLHDARRKKLILSVYAVTDRGLSHAVQPAVIAPRELCERSDEFQTLVTPHPRAVQPLLPPEFIDRLEVVEELDAHRLLAPPPSAPWPASREEADKTCEPVYVRPAVFVKPEPAKRPAPDAGHPE